MPKPRTRRLSQPERRSEGSGRIEEYRNSPLQAANVAVTWHAGPLEGTGCSERQLEIIALGRRHHLRSFIEMQAMEYRGNPACAGCRRAHNPKVVSQPAIASADVAGAKYRLRNTDIGCTLVTGCATASAGRRDQIRGIAVGDDHFKHNGALGVEA